MNLKQLLLLLSFFIYISANAQLSQLQSQKIDSLFAAWIEEGHPGGAIGIMRKGEIVYSKAFGLASLEYGVPNATETIFNTGSVSKQFTAMGIVLLHQRGLLSVDDDIRKYLPDMPDFGHKITIRHMLHHTSGMRSLHAMLALAGWREDDSRTNEDLYRFMLKQKDLNFVPGEEYLYCNTGYMLMVNIIENITKEKFPQWMNANIFEPLGMANTYVEDRYDRIVPNNATSYYQEKDGFYRAVEYWGYVGSGNMHSTTKDLLTWLHNFNEPKPGWEAAFEMLKTTDKLNDGSDNNYAFGVNVGEFNGYDKVSHGGAIGGFRANVSVYPEEELGIAILTNFSSSNAGRIERNIANILLVDKSPETDEIASPNSKTEPELDEDVSKINLQDYTGKFYSPELESTMDIYLEDNQLMIHHARHGDFPINLVKKDQLEIPGFATLDVVRNKKKKITGVNISNGRARNVWFEKQ
ncbi:MAG: beta-lactamase family protein [Bacteroidetes bacterium]|nr:beta-lactamase family protein [Bacteroidota bacterium]